MEKKGVARIEFNSGLLKALRRSGDEWFRTACEVLVLNFDFPRTADLQ